MKREDIHWLDEEQTQPVEEEYNEQPMEKPVPKNAKKRIALIALVALCIACIGAFFLSDTFYNMLHHQTTYTLRPTSASAEYSSDGVTSVHSFNGLAVRVNGNGAQAINAGAEVIWDCPYTMNSPYFVQSGQYAAIADLKGNQICIIDTEGLVNTITTEGSISFCQVNANGDTAVVIGGDGSNTILVYSREGNILVRRITYVSEDGIPIAVALSDDAAHLATSYAVYSETELRSVITLFNLTGDTSQAIDKIAGNYSYSDSLITELRYMGDELLYVGDNRIGGIRITANTSQDWEETLTYQISSFDFGDDFLAVLYGDGMAGVSGQPASNFIIYSASGAHTIELNIDSADAVAVDAGLIVYQQGLTYTAIQPDGSSCWYYTADGSLQHLYALNSEYAMAATGSAIEILKVTGMEETEVEVE